ncbi:MAG: hypothetical protein LKI80_16680 [Sporolactobacillus sp.]|jgi:hypothetical protein|nr:hypothetical protein [Sporolactobacillus sp.]
MNDSYTMSDELQAMIDTVHVKLSEHKKRIDTLVKIATGIDDRYATAERSLGEANMAYLNDPSNANKKALDEARQVMQAVKNEKAALPQLKAAVRDSSGEGDLKDEIIAQAGHELNVQQSARKAVALKKVADAKAAYLDAMTSLYTLHQEAIAKYRGIVEDIGVAYDDWTMGPVRKNKPQQIHVDFGVDSGKNLYYIYEPEIINAYRHGINKYGEDDN